MPNTIILRGEGLQKEAAAAASITPGHLIQVNGAGTLQVHGAAAGSAQKAFAIENEVIGNGIDVVYTVGENVIYSVLQPGAEVNAFVAAGVTVTAGDFLESAGDGTLRKVATSAATANTSRASVIAQATETVVAGGSDARVRVTIL